MREIILIGELAAHIFVPRNCSRYGPIPEGQIQLGGGVGMMARYLNSKGIKFKIISLTGNDMVGVLLRSSINELGECSPTNLIDVSKPSSIVYMYYDEEFDGIDIIAGNPDPNILSNNLTTISKESLIYCPYFPGYENIARVLINQKYDLLTDFGHFSYAKDSNLIMSKILGLPAGYIAQISGAGLLESERYFLLEAARNHGYPFGFVTAGADKFMGFDKTGFFELYPPKVKVKCPIGAGDILIAELLFNLSVSNDFRDGCAKGLESSATKCERWGVLA